MAYSAESDFLKRIKKSELDKLTAVSAGDGLTAAGILSESISTADSMIDSYLSSQISTLPLDTVPKIITQASVDIAIYHLHSRIQYIDIPEWVKTRYDTTIAWLKDVARGVAAIESLDTTEETIVTGIDYGSDRLSVFNSDTF